MRLEIQEVENGFIVTEMPVLSNVLIMRRWVVKSSDDFGAEMNKIVETLKFERTKPSGVKE